MFDWFGVLCSKVFQDWVDQNTLDPEGLRKLRNLADQLDLGRISLDAFYDSIGTVVNKSGSQCGTELYSMVRIDGEMSEIVRQLRKQYVVSVLSNIHEEFLARLLSDHPDINPDVVMTSSELGALKPDPLIFERACERLRVSAGDILFVDDSELNVSAARRVGLLGILFTTPSELRAELKIKGVL